MRALVISAAIHAIVFAGALSMRVAPPAPPAKVIEMRLVEPELPAERKAAVFEPARAERKALAKPAEPRAERKAPVHVAVEAPAPAVAAREEGKAPERVAVEPPREGGATPSVAGGDPRQAVLDLSVHALPPTMNPGAGPATAHVRGPTDRLPQGVQSDGEGNYHYRDSHFTALIDRDGTVHFDDDLPVGLGGGAIVSFDLTEAAMMAVGDDPYRHEKRKFMEETGEFRAALCSADRSERMKTALLRLPKQLERVWQDARLDPTERRRRLFALWDECAEGSADVEQAKMGAMARAVVLGFIQRHLPAGSPDAYSRQELATLNEKRVSKSPFAPY